MPTVVRNVLLERVDGPVRIYDAGAADQDWAPKPVGFTSFPVGKCAESPLTWEGDDG